MKKKELTIVILNYNTKEVLKDCLESLTAIHDKTGFEIIVVDNGSSDGSVAMVKSYYPNVRCLKNRSNLGFARGNNAAKKYVKSKYVLFLNTDTIFKDKVLDKSLEYMKKDEKIGALTCKLVLLNGELDKDTRRSFPTPWVAFTHFSGLDKLFPKSRLFARYWYGYLSPEEIHEVDAIQGAFFLTKKNILDKVGWFSEDYFLDGEDIDLCWKIKKLGYKLVYFPKVSIIHLKGVTKGKNKSTNIKNKSERLKYVLAGVNAMEIFYKKYLEKNYNIVVNIFVFAGIKILKSFRYLKVQLEYL